MMFVKSEQEAWECFAWLTDLTHIAVSSGSQTTLATVSRFPPILPIEGDIFWRCHVMPKYLQGQDRITVPGSANQVLRAGFYRRVQPTIKIPPIDG